VAIPPRPPAEVIVDSELMGELLRLQFPELATLPRKRVAEGPRALDQVLTDTET